MKHTLTTIHPSFPVAMEALADAIAEGWALDPANPPELVGFAYAVTLVRDDAPPVKLTRGEILANARAAKIAKAIKA